MAQTREELEKQLAALEKTAIDGDPKVTAKQHSEGKLTARERIDKLLDPGSFVEEFMLAETQCTDFGMADKKLPSDGVVTGFGKIDGRHVYVFSQDRAVLAGTVGSTHAEKIAYVIQTARKLGVPLIGLNDSAGARIQEGLSVTTAIGKIFFENSISSGVIPQISAVMGPCIGVGSYSPALTDFILMVQNTSQMFITGPAVIKEVLGETITMEELGGAKIHSEVSGVTDLVAKNDEECLAMIRRLLGFLPSSFESAPPRKETKNDPTRSLDTLEKIVPEDMRKAYNILQVIKTIVDDGDFLELKAKFARNLVIGFGRLDGYPVGFVANQPMFLAGSLDVDASDKGSRFIRFCDAFNIPIITLMDVPGFFPGKQQEEKGIIRHGAKKGSFAMAPSSSTPMRKRRCLRSRWFCAKATAGPSRRCAPARWERISFSYGRAWNSRSWVGAARSMFSISGRSSSRRTRRRPDRKKSPSSPSVSADPSRRFRSNSPTQR